MGGWVSSDYHLCIENSFWNFAQNVILGSMIKCFFLFDNILFYRYILIGTISRQMFLGIRKNISVKFQNNVTLTVNF